MFGTKIFCNQIRKKVKINTAKSCNHFSPSAVPKGLSPSDHAKRVLSKNYKPTCDHCIHNNSFRL